MNTSTSIETKQPLACLAIAIADSLDNPATPGSLMDGLREVASALIDELSGGNSAFHLRALARVYKDGDVTRLDLASPDLPMEACAGSGVRADPKKNAHSQHWREITLSTQGAVTAPAL